MEGKRVRSKVGGGVFVMSEGLHTRKRRVKKINRRASAKVSKSV
jgi:hypothetical protein